MNKKMTNMCNNLIYTVLYYDQEKNGIRTYEINGSKTFVFIELILINPHNIRIINVEFGRTITCQILYSDLHLAFNNICKIRSSVTYDMKKQGYSQSQMEEVFHVIDLWLTKFVPHTSS